MLFATALASCGPPDDPVERTTFALLTDPSLVKPVLECVTQQDATHYTAFFGYSNTVAETVSVPVGANNKFTPSPQDRGQPIVFQPGRRVSVFSVPFNGSNLVWKLGPRTSTASSGSKRCVTNLAPVVTGSASPEPASVGQTVDLTAIATDDGVPSAVLSYQWSLVIGPSTPSIGNATQSVANVVFTVPGSYVVRVTVSDSLLSAFADVPVEITGFVCGPPSDWDDGNPCTVDACSAAIGVTHAVSSDGTECSDGNLCNGTELCSAGACTAGTALVVDDGNVCTVDTCSPLTGVVHAAVDEGTVCDDGDLCDGVATCNGAGECAAGVPPIVDDGNSCTFDLC
ncbi:MAG: PKD domain-containing protein, partial [Deltaproteobacteria bacterium]|nr:PKD domain-containing protein [Deltaproteobacteria bacterium]